MSFSMVEKSFMVSDIVKREVLRSPAGVRGSCPPLKCRVIASEELRSAAKSKPFSVSELASSRIGDFAKDVHIGTNSRGYLKIMTSTSEQSSRVWRNFPSLAPDIHSSNIHLEVNPPRLAGGELDKRLDSFVLKVTKNIPLGGELLLWFSEEILAIIDMPFLTPKNITGHKKYSCHICNESFEYPNPLKVHLLLCCGRESMAQLWQKIAKTIWKQHNASSLRAGQHKSAEQFCLNSLERPTSAYLPQISIKVAESTRCLSEPPTSAFLPYKRACTDSSKGESNKRHNSATSSPVLAQPLNLCMSQPISENYKLGTTQHPWIDNSMELRLSKSLEELSSNYAADVELFASNWGKMKQGHLCVYCGKVYSRKYGLKIHIRTHTGYKPLKCKFCQRPFGDPSNLNKHVRLHASGLTPYMCSLCGKVLVRRRDLDRHMKSQHGSEDNNCSSDDNIDIDE